MNGLKASGLGKRFPGVVALKDVNLEVAPGQIVALVGANGAGKSTLIKILTGFYDHYEGQVEIEGRPVSITRPSRAITYGLEAVHQEIDTVLIPYLTVTENLLIEKLAKQRRRPWIRWRALHQEAREIARRVGLEIDVRRRAEDLVLHEKQMLVIARAVSHHVRYLIFDEPTTSLSLPEVERLFNVIRELKTRGVGIIYISHRLNEVREIADEVVVLRNGERVASFAAAEFNIKAITEAMLGAPVEETFPARESRPPGEVVLEVKGLSRRPALRDLNFQLRKGEVLGIAGLVGAGKTELLRVLFGADKPDSGQVYLNGQRLRLNSPSKAVRHGIFLVPEERRKHGVLVEDSVRKNVSLPFLSQFSFLLGFINRVSEIRHTRQVIDQVGLIPPRVDQIVRNLSGGNQQKVAVGKWFGKPPQVMMFDEATQGIDVKAKRDIYQMVTQLRERAGIIYASSDIDEVVGLADRILVLRDGRIAAELTQAEADRRLILEIATGAQQEPEPAANEAVERDAVILPSRLTPVEKR